MTDETSENKSSKESQSAGESDENFLIVGLGASAGGIHALKEFFAQVPKDSGMAYVVILHMSPEHESHLAQILQVASPIPVTQVRERVKVNPNHVYVVPPTHNLADLGHRPYDKIAPRSDARCGIFSPHPGREQRGSRRFSDSPVKGENRSMGIRD